MAYIEMVKSYKKDVAKATAKYEILKNLDIFVLDNSLRESTVGALRGHTVEDKRRIYAEAKKCGFKDHIIASFSNMTRVDDVFAKSLIDAGEDRSTLWAFSEVTASSSNKVPDTNEVPLGLRKMKEYCMWNAILEIDLGDMIYDFSRFTVDDMCKLLLKWITWCHDHLNENSKVIVNIRDLPDMMPSHPERLFQVVDYLSKLPDRLRLFGLNFEEPRGLALPEECGTWTRYIRDIMSRNNWDGHLLVHVHDRYGFADAVQLEVLMSGADGIWASVCIEGGFVGHASITVTLTNLIRMGNTKVLDRYNCTYLREAAINVTQCTTGLPPFGKQIVYGERALDYVFDLRKENFDLATFFGERAPVRISSVASPEMIVERLKYLFGNNKEFSTSFAKKMKATMLADLLNNRKEEYMSKYGLAVLFERSGGNLTERMRDIIVDGGMKNANAISLIRDVRAMWDDINQNNEGRELVSKDLMEYDLFYNGFMVNYFSCFRCPDTNAALSSIGIDADGYIEWKGFEVFLMWAVYEYPNILDVRELLDTVFYKAIIPTMADALDNNPPGPSPPAHFKVFV